ncbi:MAG: pitrilysin family protein [Gammaproteobacteria bacterium]|nr:MAG: pitrilysin family protein [Gammaproteobacteria bacterium]
MLNKTTFWAILLCGISISPTMLAADVQVSQYTPPSLYKYQLYKLKNGLQVLLKRRHGARNVSIRVVVNVGHYDFACDKQDTAHYLEHLLFTGTSRSSEVELDKRIDNHGGYWNATTSPFKTIYELDIFSPYQNIGLDTLYEIYTDSVISDKNVEKSRKIIYRERGGESSDLRHWLFERGIGRGAWKNAAMAMLPGSGYACPQRVRPEGITRQEIRQTYKKYYVPNNTVIIVVGDINIKKTLSHIKKTFGTLKRKPIKTKKKSYPIAKTRRQIVTGTLAPFLGHDGTIALAYRTQGRYSKGHYNRMVMVQYLKTRLTRVLRYQHSLAYSPTIFDLAENDFGLIALTATVKQKDMTRTQGIMEQEIKKLKNGKVLSKEIEETKRQILLQWVQGYEANTTYADFYASLFDDIRRFGALRRLELAVEKVTPLIVQQTAKRVFKDETMVIIRSTPTLTYTQFYITIVIIVLIMGLLVYLLVRRHRKRKQHR